MTIHERLTSEYEQARYNYPDVDVDELADIILDRLGFDGHWH